MLQKKNGTYWKLAELNVLSCQKLQVEAFQEISATIDMEEKTEDEIYECEVELITGRTHQIRLQFSASGSPVVGDTRYKSVAGLHDTGEDDAVINFGPDPSKIGLHCSKLVIPMEDCEGKKRGKKRGGKKEVEEEQEEEKGQRTLHLTSKFPPWRMKQYRGYVDVEENYE